MRNLRRTMWNLWSQPSAGGMSSLSVGLIHAMILIQGAPPSFWLNEDQGSAAFDLLLQELMKLCYTHHKNVLKSNLSYMKKSSEEPAKSSFESSKWMFSSEPHDPPLSRKLSKDRIPFSSTQQPLCDGYHL